MFYGAELFGVLRPSVDHERFLTERKFLIKLIIESINSKAIAKIL